MYKIRFLNPDNDEYYFNLSTRIRLLREPILVREGSFYYEGDLSDYAQNDSRYSHLRETNAEANTTHSEATFDDLPESATASTADYVPPRPRRFTI